MKILIYGLNFAPEPTGIGKYTGEFANWLAEHGHVVEVLCGQPHYPQWQLQPGFSNNYRVERPRPNLTIRRIPHYIPGVAELSARARIRLETTFNLGALRWWLPVLFARPRFDLVVTICPPTQTVGLPWIYSKLRGVPWLLWIQDFQLDAAIKLGMLRGSRLARALYGLERFFITRASYVASISGPMCRLAIAKGAAPAQVIELPNWSNIELIDPKRRDLDYRNEMGLSEQDFVVVYSGAMGEKQGLGLILESAEALKSTRQIRFIIAGDGPARAGLEADAAQRGLDNVKFIGVQPLAAFLSLLAISDVQLVIQKEAAADLVMPSKLTNILAAGRVCIATAPPGSAIADVLERAQAGIVVMPDQAEGLTSAIRQLLDQPSLRESMGRNARKYAEAFLDRDAILRRLIERLESEFSAIRTNK